MILHYIPERSIDLRLLCLNEYKCKCSQLLTIGACIHFCVCVWGGGGGEGFFFSLKKGLQSRVKRHPTWRKKSLIKRKKPPPPYNEKCILYVFSSGGSAYSCTPPPCWAPMLLTHLDISYADEYW